MHRSIISWLVLSLLALTADGAPHALAQTAPSIEFAPVAKLGSGSVSGKVLDGIEAKAADWPATFYATISRPDGIFVCTATLVGSRVLLTAAHCVPDGGKISISSGGQTIAATCTHHPAYDASKSCDSEDYALCRTDSALTGITSETISLNPARVKKDDEILLAGYGCTNPQLTGLGKLYIGLAPAETLPSAGSNYIVTGGAQGICPGDSGGAAYQRSDTSTNLVKPRTIIGVNSCYRFEMTTDGLKAISLLSSTGVANFKTFEENWRAANANEVIKVTNE